MTNLSRRSLLIAGAAPVTLMMSGYALGQDTAISEIKKRGTLVVGTEAAFEPYEFLRDGKVVGYGRDLLEIVADHLGVKIEQLNLPFQGLLPGLLAKKFDLVASSIGVNPERVRRFAYTRPVGSVDVQVVARQGDDRIKKIDDVAGKVVGTQLGSAVQPQAVALETELKSRLGQGFGELKLFQTYADAVLAMSNKQIDAVMTTSNVTDTLSIVNPNTLRVVGTTTATRYLCWLTRPDQLGLRAFINDTIAELIANGQMAKLQKKWLGRTYDLPATGYLPAGAI